MLKSIKKIVNILTGIVAVVLLTLIVLFFICRIPSVQTFIVKKITYYISKETKSTISFGKITFTFFNRIEITDVLVKDQHNDTLLYAQNITAGIRQINTKRQMYRIGKVVVMKPVFNLISDSTGLMNLNWYLNLIQKPKDTTSRTNSYFHINQIDISDGRFSHINKYAPRTNTPIDFNNLRIAGINAIVENLDNYNDSTRLDIYNLGCRESTGLIVKKMSSNLLVHNQNIIFRNFALLCDSSIINADRVGILADSSASFRKFYEEVKLDIALRKSLISSSDLKYFVSSLKDYHESIWLSGDIKGSVAELKGRHIKATYKDETNLDFDFDFSGLPDIEKTFMFIDVIDFSSISKDVEQVFIPGKGRIVLPETLRKLGVVSFSGTFTGFITDFVTYSKINTKKGIISTDISLRPFQSGSYNVKGLLKGSDIDLGSITDNPALFGKLSMEANVNGSASSIKKFAINLTAKIDSIEINNYKYRNIALNGYFTDKTWDGNIKVEDENIIMELLGKFDFSSKLPEFDFSLKMPKANLNRLNLAKSDTSSHVSLMMTANFRGNSIDNLDGEIKLLNSNFRRNSKNLNISDFSIKSFILNNKPAINIRTDFMDANLFGRYNFEEIQNSLKRKLALLMPSRFENPKISGKANDNNFIFDIRFKNTDGLNKFFNTGITLSENSQIQGTFNPDSMISVMATAKQFSFGNNIFNNLTIEANFADTTSGIIIKSSSLDFSGLSELKDLNLSFNSIPDKFRFNFDWDNQEKTRNQGSVIAEGGFEKSSPEQKRAILRIGLQPADVYIRNNLWKITPAVIQVDSNSIKFEKLSFRSSENYFLIDGAISPNKSDTLKMEFHGISLDPLNLLYEKRQGNDPNMIRLALGGILNGKIGLTDIYKNFMFESDLSVKDFKILGEQLGEIKILSEWNYLKKVADITASNDLEGKKMIDIKGSFDPVTANADLTAKAIKLPVDILNPLLKIFASGITGTVSGKVNFFGNFTRPVLTGALKGENVSMKIDYLQTRYTFNDSIRFTPTGIKFNNITTYDDKQNTAIVSGEVTHKNFKNFAVDLNIAIPSSNDFMILNTKPKDNELFYGTAYGSGITSIRSNSSGLSFDISARTGKDTRFFIPLSKGGSVSDRSFINFVEKNTDKATPGTNQKAALSVQTKPSFDMNFDLEVTPDAEVQIIFDAKAGDKMRGTGTGNLNINLNRKGDFKINGDYLIEDGDYLFTVGGLLNKKFIVQNGGKITFNGDIQNAEIDIKAIYKTKARLYDIMANMVGTLPQEKLNEKIPVEVWLNLTGNLYNPIVAFDIYLPTANEETRAYLKSMIVTDEEMSRQVLFLLVMNSFYADPALTATGSQNSANIGTATVGVTTTEMLSNQVSNWLSQISRDVDIGVAYRPGSTELPNSQEVELALSTQILNDRVKINGNFDYGGSQSAAGSPSANRQLSGAFYAEYKILKNSDKLQFRVFNRSNDNFYFDNSNGVQYTQGVGLFFKQDFNKLRDLFSKKPKRPVKKEEETKIKNK